MAASTTSTSRQLIGSTAAAARMHGIYDHHPAALVLPPLHHHIISTTTTTSTALMTWDDVDSANFPNHNMHTPPSTLSPVHTTTTTTTKGAADYSSHESLGPASTDTQPPKTHNISDKLQRRLAQNREAARKSRLRKKAYVQQLESGRMKLAQLEQELERARQQGVYGTTGLLNTAGNNPLLMLPGTSTVNSGIATFEMEYEVWAVELQKKECELRNVQLLQPHINDNDLRLFVDSVLNHYYDLFRLKADAAKADIFYLMSGAWRTPVERFFFWIGGFRPSELLAVLAPQLEPLTEPQVMSVSNLRQSCQQAEDALSQGMDKLQQTLAQSICISLDDIISNGVGGGSINAISSTCYNTHLVSAMERLEALENFLNQADHLRQQTLQQMSRILTARQAARGLLALGEYLHRLQALSSLWSTRTSTRAV